MSVFVGGSVYVILGFLFLFCFFRKYVFEDQAVGVLIVMLWPLVLAVLILMIVVLLIKSLIALIFSKNPGGSK